ncbi:MAG TPA: hypothetical protein VGH33_20440, partial [Isosphaeraceae bacterium]
MGALRRWSVAVMAVLAPVVLAAADDAPEAVIRGTVVDEEGRPVPGATVDMIGREILGLVDPLLSKTAQSGPA